MTVVLKSYFGILFGSIFTFSSGASQGEWHLKKDQGGIRIYMRSNNHSSFNEIKAEMTIDSKLSALAALLLDVHNHTNWVYSVKTCYLLRQVSNNELYYYEVIDSPFPANDRDLIVHLKIMQDSISRVMTVTATNIPDYMPAKKNVVRVPLSKEFWHVVPSADNLLRIEYYLEVDPGGSVPAWLINSFAEKGPFETFRRLQQEVDIPKYRDAALPFIRN
ncbi:MAG TPA: START domain-containing protein [Puia sp.]|nr:START domain-containing protein [Puia sp.]